MSLRDGAVERNPDLPGAEQAAMTPALSYGPWSPTCDRIERGRQLRSLAALAVAYVGPAHPLWTMLRIAETDAIAFVRAQDIVEELPALAQRKLLSTFMRVTWPPKRCLTLHNIQFAAAVGGDDAARVVQRASI